MRVWVFVWCSMSALMLESVIEGMLVAMRVCEVCVCVSS